MAAKTKANWVAIEGLYRIGDRALRDIGDEYYITESAIRKRAKRKGWARDASATKREIVRQAMSGTQDVLRGPQGAQDIQEAIEEAATQDIGDMQRGLRIQRHCLMSLEQAAEVVTDAREVKIIVEAAGSAIDSIRRIRGLDQELRDKNGTESDIDDDARAEDIANRLVKRAARGSIVRAATPPKVGLGLALVGEG